MGKNRPAYCGVAGSTATRKGRGYLGKLWRKRKRREKEKEMKIKKRILKKIKEK